jgi:hypothetical protein
VKADGAISWANVWVSNYLSLSDLIDEVAEQIDAAARATSGVAAGAQP